MCFPQTHPRIATPNSQPKTQACAYSVDSHTVTKVSRACGQINKNNRPAQAVLACAAASAAAAASRAFCAGDLMDSP